MKVFNLNRDKIQLDQDEILLHKEFAELLQRDKSEDKVRALKEFKYIYAICDYRSYPNRNGIGELDTKKYAIELSDLGESYTPDKQVLAAIKLYKKLTSTVVRETNIELLKAFSGSHKIIKLIRKEIDSLLQDFKSKSDMSSENRTKAIRDLINRQKEIMEIGREIPKSTNEILLSMKQIVEEENKIEGSVARGGSEIEDSMNPDTDIVPRYM